MQLTADKKLFQQTTDVENYIQGLPFPFRCLHVHLVTLWMEMSQTMNRFEFSLKNPPCKSPRSLKNIDWKLLSKSIANTKLFLRTDIALCMFESFKKILLFCEMRHFLSKIKLIPILKELRPRHITCMHACNELCSWQSNKRNSRHESLFSFQRSYLTWKCLCTQWWNSRPPHTAVK